MGARDYHGTLFTIHHCTDTHRRDVGRAKVLDRQRAAFGPTQFAIDRTGRYVHRESISHYVIAI